jgi:hypothetical protein
MSEARWEGDVLGPLRPEEPRRGRRAASHAVPAIVLALVGVAFVAYGVSFHARTVLLPQEAKPPVPIVPKGLFPFLRPGAVPQVEEAQPASIIEPEPRLIREVTVGGVTRTQAGELKRTYAGEAPKLCPT